MPDTAAARPGDPGDFTLAPREPVLASRTDRWLAYFGLPAGIAAFLAIYYLPLPAGLSLDGQAALAAFILALIWWVTEPVPTYLTSLVLMILLVAFQAQEVTAVLSVLGLDVIWLNILAFILAAMLSRTPLARRIGLALIDRFGWSAGRAMGAFVLLQLVLAPLIPATAARAAMTLPLMTMVAAMYGSSASRPNNFGRNLFLVNLTGISILSSTVMTGSAANLLAVGLLQTMGGHRVYYLDWLLASAPIAVLTVVAAWLAGPRLVFPIPPAQRVPQATGGSAAIHEARGALGPMQREEWRAITIFALVIALWATDRFQARWFGIELGAPIAAMIGAVIALWPGVGLLRWKDTDIPWHLMIFSAGAYAGGLALHGTGAAAWGMERILGSLTTRPMAFGWTYALVVGVMLYSHLLSTSKTVRTIIMIPIIIVLARRLGWEPASLALPAAFTIDWVIGLPISGKPNVILYASNQYSARDNLRYGLTVCTIGYLLLLVAGMTWFHWLGLTPAFGTTPP
ncbi:MAG TPA: SLC13 family permease [Gemmatimonadales bacterium]|nr:SLC13 family permease [Gemmatimonadales bacterium]